MCITFVMILHQRLVQNRQDGFADIRCVFRGRRRIDGRDLVHDGRHVLPIKRQPSRQELVEDNTQ